jgi:hypothetical protein
MTDYQGETLDDIISGIRNKASLFEEDAVVSRYVDICQASFNQLVAADGDEERALASMRFNQLLNSATYTAATRLYSLINGAVYPGASGGAGVEP